ncbi:PH domain-containing protein [Streptomyces harbinensis]|uniref:PH domain-containing protein n=1 Tax=Streptomyces harbinensis TaxID=1176198 RepID=UPI0033982FE4
MRPPEQAPRRPPSGAGTPGAPWQRLSTRVIWVDLVQSIASLLPAVVALAVFGVAPGSGQLWPLIGFAAFGVLGAIADALRWAFTRYRITASHVEMKTGVFLRVERSIRRDRVRSVDIEARPRHRLFGLRVVNIGAGQQAAEGESALALDAVSTADARALQDRLLRMTDATAEPDGAAPAGEEATRTEETAPLAVLARFRPGWVVYHMMSVWAYVLALGFGWGIFWLLGSSGVDVTGFVAGLLDWEAIGWAGTVAIAFLAVTLFGVIGLAVNYFAEYGNFELARVRGTEGTLLRTRQGLFTTREVNRDENRIRGVQLSEPLLWRWLRACDTSVITTGLSMWSMARPAAVLPRGPVTVARRVAAEVLGGEGPWAVSPKAHPAAALRRRLWWATLFTAAVGLTLLGTAAAGLLPYAALWAAAALWPCALGAAFVAYRALGHAVTGPYLVMRSGLFHRSTTVLRRSAVSTIVIRESLLQRRLGLRSVSAMTAAGYGGYDLPDLDADESVAFAAHAAPGVLDPFLVRPRDGAPPQDERPPGAGGARPAPRSGVSGPAAAPPGNT